MALYTIELSRVIENIVLEKTGKSKHEFASHEEMIDIASPFIFDDYPLFEESHRLELNRKIISHYYFRELCAVPWQRWRFYINENMKLIMPKFNQLYESVNNKYDIFENLNWTETMDRDLTGNQTHKNDKVVSEIVEGTENKQRDLLDDISTEQASKNDLDSKSSRMLNETPMTRLANSDYSTELNVDETLDKETGLSTGKQKQTSKLTDLTETNKDNETISKSDNVSNTENTENYTKTIKGKNSARSNSELLMEARRAIINIDEDIVNSLSSNFSGYYN